MATTLMRVYQTLLALYPQEFRKAYGEEMAGLFADHCREEQQRGGTVGLVGLGAHTLADLTRSALRERAAARWRVADSPDLEGFAVREHRKEGFWRVFEYASYLGGGIGTVYLCYGLFPGYLDSAELGFPRDVMLMAGLLVVWMVVLTCVQSLAMRLFSGTWPRLRWEGSFRTRRSVTGGLAEDGHRFGKWEFLALSAAPLMSGLVVFPACALLSSLFGIHGGADMVVYSGGLVAGMSLSILLPYAPPVLAAPSGTMVEELENRRGSVRLYRPDRSLALGRTEDPPA